ncbi:MAG: hypothetical protein LAT57_14190 [Balneolales bacterium]|nr:hypothetical protein [Balneolales bacterium]
MSILKQKEVYMDIKSAKIELVRLIVGIDNPQGLAHEIDTISAQKEDFWNELVDSLKEEIRLGIQELDKGNRTDFDEFIRQVS